MPIPFWNHFARLPRHVAADTTSLSVGVKSQDAESWQPAQLEDLSRQGIRFRIGEMPRPDEVVEVRLCNKSSAVSATVVAVVRWRGTDGEPGVSIGCEFCEALSWELIGELFLSGALETDGVAS